jgi:SPP1 gp7 family putative phage head morphogenesis protein
MNSADLLQQQLNTPGKRKARGVRPDMTNGINYNVELQRIVKSVSRDVNAVVMPVVRNLAPEYQRDAAITLDSWVDVLTAALRTVKHRYESPQFLAVVADIARRFVTTANNSNRRRTERDLGINIYSDSQTLQDYLAVSTADNVALIKSIPSQYLTQVESIVMANVRAGGRPSNIAKALQQQLGVTERRAKMIARDQVNKINSNLASMRIKDVGYKYFKWETSNDERVRDRHEDVSERVTAYGKGVYRFDNPPIVDQNLPQLPGEPIQCRCVMIPISQEEVKENQRKGLTNPSVKR